MKKIRSFDFVHAIFLIYTTFQPSAHGIQLKVFCIQKDARHDRDLWIPTATVAA